MWGSSLCTAYSPFRDPGYFHLLADPEEQESWDGKNSRAFAELPYHLVMHALNIQHMVTLRPPLIWQLIYCHVETTSYLAVKTLSCWDHPLSGSNTVTLRQPLIWQLVHCHIETAPYLAVNIVMLRWPPIWQFIHCHVENMPYSAVNIVTLRLSFILQ